MRNLTNNFTDVELWNLNLEDGDRGPFLVVQKGVAPEDPRMREQLYVLRRDGTWGDLMHYLSGGKSEALDEAAFATTGEIMHLMGELGPRAVVADLAVDEAGLQAWLARSGSGDFRENVQRFVREFRTRHPLPTA